MDIVHISCPWIFSRCCFGCRLQSDELVVSKSYAVLQHSVEEHVCREGREIAFLDQRHEFVLDNVAVHIVVRFIFCQEPLMDIVYISCPHITFRSCCRSCRCCRCLLCRGLAFRRICRRSCRGFACRRFTFRRLTFRCRTCRGLAFRCRCAFRLTLRCRSTFGTAFCRCAFGSTLRAACRFAAAGLAA